MIVLDLDGVMADFANAACWAHQKKDYKVERWNFFEDWGIDIHEFWRVIHALGDDFYRDIVQPYPWMDKVLDLVREADDFIIMSAPCDTHFGYSAKKIWCDKYIGDVKLIVGSEKQLLARKDRLLIDDYDENIRKFRNEGGACISFPQPWNCMRGQVDRRLEYLEHRLEWWKNERLNHKYATEIGY